MENTGNSTISSSSTGERAVIRLHSLGDVVQAQPAATGLSESGPVRFITAPQYIQVVERMPGNVTPLSCGEGCTALELRKLLLANEFHGIVDLQNNLTTRIATMGMKVSGRFSMNRRRRRGVLSGASENMPLRYDEFSRAANVVEGIPPELVRKSDGPRSLRVGIVAGGRWRLKSIPSEVICECARLLIDLYGAEVVVTGGQSDLETVERVRRVTARPGIETYSGENGIGGLIDIIEGLSILISPDSGPAHLASALGVPLLLLFTSTSPALGFWEHSREGAMDSGELECRPCHRHGGNVCRIGSEECRKGLLPLDIVSKAAGMVEP